jgi:hypothetical protein
MEEYNPSESNDDALTSEEEDDSVEEEEGPDNLLGLGALKRSINLKEALSSGVAAEELAFELSKQDRLAEAGDEKTGEVCFLLIACARLIFSDSAFYDLLSLCCLVLFAFRVPFFYLFRFSYFVLFYVAIFLQFVLYCIELYCIVLYCFFS